MASDKVITVMCAARLPELLVARIDAAARSAKESRAQYIAEACRMRLDSGVAQLGKSAHAISEQSGHVEVAGSNPAATTKTDRKAFFESLGEMRRVSPGLPLGVGAGSTLLFSRELPPESKDSDLDSPAIRFCGFKAYNDVDGETYTCGLAPHSPRLKHGAWRKA